ncbi:MAG: DUF305 domain-containing protein [Candidatus Moraniibacteriota bacterium]|nr:MAG: DUF305 domain-containing protein [Candidatus Moranbacteria bacterium]
MGTNKSLYLGLVSLGIGLTLGYGLWGAKTAQAPMDHSQMTMEESMDSMTASLTGKTGDTFDQAFLQEMVIHHEGAVAMAKQVLETSKRPELRKLAEDIIAAQTKEIDMMQEWEKEWYPDSNRMHH